MPSTLTFAPKYAGEGVSGDGGEHLTGNVPVYLIFTGGSSTGFGFDSSVSTDAITSAVSTLFATGYLSDLSEYGATTAVHLAQTYISPENPPASYSMDDISNLIQDSFTDGNGPLPEADDTDPSGIYIVITPPGFNLQGGLGAHDEQSMGSFLALDPDFTDFAVISSHKVRSLQHANDAPGTPDSIMDLNALDSLTTALSHELVETLTDPDPLDGIVTNGSSAFGVVYPGVLQSPGEISDNEAQLHWGYVNGVAAQSYWSQQNGAFIIPDGSLAKVTLDGTALTVFGDTPGGPLDDSVRIDRTIGGGLRVTINGEVLSYGPGVVTSVDLQLGAGTNTLIGTGGTNTWHITGADSGDLNGFVTFTGAQNLQGGTATDQFQMLPGGSISGSIKGGGGTDTLDYAGLAGPVVLDLQQNIGTGTSVSFFSGIRNFIGSASAADIFVGGGTWDITGADTGADQGSTFSSFENLSGDNLGDQFVFLPGGSISGNITVGHGINTLDYSGIAGPVTVDLQTGVATGIGGTIHRINDTVIGIDNVLGSASSADTLIGTDTNNVGWAIKGLDSGIFDALTYASFENLIGGSRIDYFIFLPGGSVSGNIEGGHGINTLYYAGIADPVTVDFQTSTSTGIGGTFSSIDNFVGSASSADTLIGSVDLTVFGINGPDSGFLPMITFASFENLVGGPGNDAFFFLPGGSVSGNIDGGGGNNLLDFANLSTPVTITLGATPGTGTATGIGGTFSNITRFIGSSAGASAIAGPNTDTAWTVAGVNTVQALGYSFGNVQTIVGGSANDTFAILSGARLDGSIDGGGGTNTITYTGYTGDVTVALLLHSATGVGGGIANIQNVAGGNGNNLLAGDATANVLQGGTGRNILIGDAGADTLIGGSKDNILIGDSTAWDGNLTALTAIFAEWSRTDLGFAQRLAHLISNGADDNALNGSYVLNKKTVTADSAGDTLIGGGPDALDWYFATSGQDSFDPQHPQDHITRL